MLQLVPCKIPKATCCYEALGMCCPVRPPPLPYAGPVYESITYKLEFKFDEKIQASPTIIIVKTTTLLSE